MERANSENWEGLNQRQESQSQNRKFALVHRDFVTISDQLYYRETLHRFQKCLSKLRGIFSHNQILKTLLQQEG